MDYESVFHQGESSPVIWNLYNAGKHCLMEIPDFALSGWQSEAMAPLNLPPDVTYTNQVSP
jgi:hypothetical protein